MAYSPSQRWEKGVLVERALSSHSDTDEENLAEAKATRDYKAPVATKYGEAGGKAVQSSEVSNKGVSSEATSGKRKRA